jgi:hypothetical protein
MTLHGETIHEELPQHLTHQPYRHIRSGSCIDVEPLIRDPVRCDEQSRTSELRVGAVKNDFELGVDRSESSCDSGIGRRRPSRQEGTWHAEGRPIDVAWGTGFDGRHFESGVLDVP